MELGGAGEYAMARELSMASLGAADAYMGANSASAMDLLSTSWRTTKTSGPRFSEEAADAIRAAL